MARLGCGEGLATQYGVLTLFLAGPLPVATEGLTLTRAGSNSRVSVGVFGEVLPGLSPPWRVSREGH